MENFEFNEKRKGTFQYTSLIGIILAAISIIIFLLNYDIFGVEGKLIVLNYLFTIVAMVFGAQFIRKECYNGYMDYGRSLWTTFSISLYSVIIFSIFMALYIYFNKGYAQDLLVAKEQVFLMINPNASSAELDKVMSLYKSLQNPVLLFFTTLFSEAISGFIIALIVSIFVKKKEPIGEIK
ncbi:MAG: DUF4199 domain-containing protein [Hyphomicrobiales bacterium]